MLPPIDAVAFRAIRRLGPRLFYTVHDIRPHYGQWRSALLDTRPLYDLADELVLHTEANRAELCELTGRDPAHVHVISQGNLVDWSGPPVPREEARARLHLPPDVPIALFFGAIKPYKRLDFALRSLARVLERLPSARLLIAGRPDGPFAPYQQLIDGLGLSDAVVKRLGYVPEEEVALCFSAADALALPYTDADFSGVVLAAYTFGRPVVATETGGLRQVIEDGRSGTITPPDDLDAFAAALTRVLGARALGERLGARARELALTKYDWSIGAAELMALYHG
jgi:glycosyltransferase involved in cell wall biosynthesis